MLPRMRGRAILLITASWVLLAAALIVLYFCDTGPSYNGRSLAEWIKAASQPSSEREAHEAIVRIATNSYTTLVRWAFADTSPRFALMNRLPFSARLNPLFRPFLYRDAAMFRAACAVRAFEVAGTNAAPAVPALDAMVTDYNPGVTTQAIHLLSLIGPAAIPALRRALNSQQPFIRVQAVGALRHCGTNSVEAISDLVKALSDYDINVRQNATNVLETLCPAVLTNALPR